VPNRFNQVGSEASIAGFDVGVREVFFGVADRQLSHLLRSSLDVRTWVAVAEPNASAVLVSDDLARDTSVSRRRVVEVAAPFPRGASHATRHAFARVSQGAILADDCASITAALSAIASGGVFVSERVFELAERFPALTARQDALLELLTRGESPKAIARALEVSLATVNREFDWVERLLAVTGRTALASTAVSLGFPPPRGSARSPARTD
jgi:DNA-binding CsgD family transcriptional regulator